MKGKAAWRKKGLPSLETDSKGNGSPQRKQLLSGKLRSDSNSQRQPSELNPQKQGAVFPPTEIVFRVTKIEF